MVWPAVARSYVRSFERARDEHAERQRMVFQAKTLGEAARRAAGARISRTCVAMTDDTGILQHAAFNVPRYEDGYCVDDNARALLLDRRSSRTPERRTRERVRALGVALPRVRAATRSTPTRGRFRNFMSYSRDWLEECGSEDSHGRALWALGDGRRSLAAIRADRASAADSFTRRCPHVANFTSPRAWAFALLGIDEYLRAFQGESDVQSVRKALAERLLDCIGATSEPDWPWFEDRLTYCNARLLAGADRVRSAHGRTKR